MVRPAETYDREQFSDLVHRFSAYNIPQDVLQTSGLDPAIQAVFEQHAKKVADTKTPVYRVEVTDKFVADLYKAFRRLAVHAPAEVPGKVTPSMPVASSRTGVFVSGGNLLYGPAVDALKSLFERTD
ncbi:MAG: hypothetical protein HY903_03340 [Deltaproteobacteria bacterium]|nr:hypothetical protein [Deltaproteobacteria bacterium]